MRLRYTPTALTELDDILSDLHSKSPQGARNVRSRLRQIIDLLLDHPQAGQLTSLQPMRRIAATPYPYVVYYEPGDTEIVIIGIRNSSRDPQTMPDQP